MFFCSFYFKSSKLPIFWGQPIFLKFFFQFQLFKQQTHKCYFNQYQYQKMHKKTFLTAKSSQNGVVDRQFLFCIFKNTDQKNICAFFVFKADSKPKHEKKNWGGVFEGPKRYLPYPRSPFWSFTSRGFIAIFGS